MSVSADGRYLVFASEATNLVSPDGNQCPYYATYKRACSDIFERDLAQGDLLRVSDA